MITLENELAKIKGIDRRFLARLHRLNIKTVKDLLWHFPSRYDDFSQIKKNGDLEVGQIATVQGEVKDIHLRQTWRKRMMIVEAMIEDDSGSIKAVWFNQPYIAKILRPGCIANFAGKATISQDDFCFSNPVYELPNSQSTGHTAGLVPIYPETKGLTSRGIRYLIRAILKNLPPLPDFIPEEILQKHDLPGINQAFQQLHFPRSLESAKQSKQRFVFEDLFLLQTHNLITRSQLAKEKANAVSFCKLDLGEIINTIPFELTRPQKQSVQEILNDIGQSRPMNRLLQGDVGSGKTVVAAIAALLTARNGHQAVFMAPTEVLAKQHYQTIEKIFAPLVSAWELTVGILTGGEARCFMGEELEVKKKKSELVKQISKGEINIIIGTHAVIQKDVGFKNLALAIVDEQHRFGVRQRAALANKTHFLSMSATPIPRTLSMTLFGDLDLSLINELPQGRHPIVTKIIAPANRRKAYDFVREQIRAGRQAFVICPRIAAPENGGEPRPEGAGSLNYQQELWSGVKAVEEEYKKLSTKVFKDLKVAMLHGRMKSQEKNEIMKDFSDNKTNILVSTSVVEIGVDIPNASIMLIEGADRFGLAQLYQFRGRVGRDKHQSFCLLFTDSTATSVHQRLKSLIEAKNGFELAEKDLQLRGPGQFLGQSQTGLPDLVMQSLNNMELIKTARAAAEDIIKKDPELKSHATLQNKLSQFRQQIHLE
ncbi:MAG: ATP-dependent DNA helicase RecG [Patescibacteria group bacterium]